MRDLELYQQLLEGASPGTVSRVQLSGRLATISVNVPHRSIQNCQRPALVFEAMISARHRSEASAAFALRARKRGTSPVGC